MKTVWFLIVMLMPPNGNPDYDAGEVAAFKKFYNSEQECKDVGIKEASPILTKEHSSSRLGIVCAPGIIVDQPGKDL